MRTPDHLRESSLQNVIKSYLIEQNGYIEGFNKNYHQKYAFDTKLLFEFLENTQQKTLNRLRKKYGSNYKNEILKELDKWLRDYKIVEVLKRGIRLYGEQLNLVYFKPKNKLNRKTYDLYKQNIFSVTEELNHFDKKRIDLVIFINGLPIITMELKNNYTNQDYEDAIKQYKQDRSPTEKLFRPKERTIVNFALDNQEIYMATELKNEETYFLPFNRGKGIGKNKGKGNPEVKDKQNTFYLWEEILQKDVLLKIINQYVFVDESGNNSTQIFPRYHQLEVVENLINDVKKNKSGETYLIQHSTGSGKTYSITWLALKLSTVHDNFNNTIFDGVIVLSDRLVLDKQLQDTIAQISFKNGFVKPIENNSNELAEAINNNTKIIVTTIQKFRFILEQVKDTKNKKYAIIIDEAHSSTTGKSMLAVKESLNTDIEGENNLIPDTEDKINEEIAKIQDLSNLSFFGFTATPKPETLKIFGTKTDKDRREPFHVYSMKQAIQEGFILDVLQNYITYQSYFHINKRIENNSNFKVDKYSGKKEIMKKVKRNDEHIRQKTEIIVEHFKNKIQHLLNGEAKAMVVTSSREEAVKYHIAFNRYMKYKGYKKMGILVAFTGKVKADGGEFTEAKLNKFPDTQTEDKFDSSNYKVLIAANKFQTGFNQPKLCAMYVDKTLRGANAVQTLSRLNRTIEGKEEPFVLDFINDPQEIQDAFETYYTATKINTQNFSPNEIYKLYNQIIRRELKPIRKNEVEKYTNVFYEKEEKDKAFANGYIYLSSALRRIEELERKDKNDYINLLKKFNQMYNLLLQITSIEDLKLHKLSLYIKYLMYHIEKDKNEKVEINNITLDYIKVKNQGKEEFNLDEGKELNISLETESNRLENRKESIDIIIDELNERYQLDEEELDNVHQFHKDLSSNQTLKAKSKNNDFDDWKVIYEEEFQELLIDYYRKEEFKEFVKKIFNDDSLKEDIKEKLSWEIYNKMND
ncbi:MAG: type I restriction endonuclease subunit R [bacterium]